ncbi:PcfJ domain-containing protein [Anaeromusa sp.]|uniref:PcfJ domain-containing protein n=1 Tax=Anaeromusa sp. TaxID=1872520 RepID=UPI00262F2E92|nr:PcfJ domain-containing protein [Anaeromusa sp.]MDD3157460.1 PcfJ domain-containing protein [Anaeromusa sp.]
MSFKEDKKHFPRLGKAFQQFMHNEAFLHSRYIFIRRLGRKRFGYCTYCHRDFELHRSYDHNEPMECPECKSQCIGKHAGRGHKTLVDRSYFVFYEKSKLDPKVVVVRGFFAVRDYGGDDIRNVQTRYDCESYYVFQSGKTPKMYRQEYRYSLEKNSYVPHMVRCKTAYSLFPKYMGQGYSIYSSQENIAAVVKGTPFQYSTWETYAHKTDAVKILALYCKHPCVEYLTKIGLDMAVKDKLYGYSRTFGVINWSGKTLPDVLRMKINKDDIQELRKLQPDSRELRIWQIFRKENPSVLLSEVLKAHRGVFSRLDVEEVVDIQQQCSLVKLAAYLEKQLEKDKEHYRYIGALGITYRDYLRDAKKLDFDLTDPSVLFPRNLQTMHQNTIKQVEIQKDEILEKNVHRRYDELKRYCFEGEAILIRPVASIDELIREGKALQHCVGTYAEQHAFGKTAILVIRETQRPEKPFYTLELKGNEVIQCRGRKNCAPTPEVDKFVAQFKLAKLGKKKGAKTA